MLTEFNNKLLSIRNQFGAEPIDVKRAKIVKEDLIKYKKEMVSEIRARRNFLNNLLSVEIKTTKDYIRNNIKKRNRKPKVDIVQEVEVKEIDPLTPEEVQQELGTPETINEPIQ